MTEHHDHDDGQGEKVPAKQGAHEHDESAHGHDNSAHSHDHAPKDFGRAFAIGIAIQSGFVLAEVGVGLAAGSLAVLADAGHNVSDVLALAVAWGASALGKRGRARAAPTACAARASSPRSRTR